MKKTKKTLMRALRRERVNPLPPGQKTHMRVV